MFLNKIREQNKKLIDTAISLHQTGFILPDTYVIDMDMIEYNAKIILNEAKRYNIKLYFMLKQLGRNPEIAKKLIDIGYQSAVVVDFNEAKVMMENNIPLGNVGNLVQIPSCLLREILEYRTEYVTVFSLEKIEQVNDVAKSLGIKQKIFLKVVDDGDYMYEGQVGGLLLNELYSNLSFFKTLKNIDINGLTSFPCFLFDSKKDKVAYTNNTKTIIRAKEILTKGGFQIKELNLPSMTSVYTMPYISELKGTIGEPGHALTGTTPLHANMDLPEKIAYVYVSEVSHNFDGHAYIYGGGLYRRGHLSNVLIHNGKKERLSKVKPFSPDNIDYYLEVEDEQEINATALMSFRTQMFVTRSKVALVKGIQNGNPEIIGIYNSLGELIRR